VVAVNGALGKREPSVCPASDTNRDGLIRIDELVASVARAMLGCNLQKGPDAVEDATRVVTIVAETTRRLVLPFGRISAGGGAGVLTDRCRNGGERRIDCLNSASVPSTRITVYDACTEVEDGLTVVRSGTERITVDQPGCPFPPPSTVPVTIELEGYTETRGSGSVEESSIVVADVMTQRIVPGPDTCRREAGEPLRNDTVAVEGTVRTTCNPASSGDCSASLRDVQLTGRNLTLRRTYAPPACDLTTAIDGRLFVANQDRDEDFAQTFTDYRVSESLIDGRRLLREDGRVTVDCLGEVRVETTQALAMDAGADLCPDQGALRIFLASGGGGAATAPAAGGGASSRTQQGGVIDSTFRAANGQVYQVLQNPSGFPEARTEDVRVTTVAASTDGISACSDRSLGAGEAQGVVAAEPGTLIPAGQVFLSDTLQLAAEPCFNPNGAAGDGLVCLGAGCGPDCRCPNQGCLTFTIAQGDPLGAPSNGGRIVAALPPFGGDCGGAAGDSTYAFGASGPTLVPGLCGAVPSDGLTLAPGQTRIIAYATPASVPFFSGAAGFLIDRDGDNQRSCPAGTVISGFATANELGTALVTFDQRSVSFDVNDDGVVERSLADCEQLSIAQCGLPPPTATATPSVPRPCPETTSFDPPVADSTRDAFNLVPGAASCGDGGIAAPDRSFVFRAPAGGCYRIDTLDTTGLAQPFDTLLYVRRGDTCTGAEIACNDNAAPGTVQSEVLVELELAQSVVIVVDGNGGARGNFRLRVEPAGGACGRTPTASPTPTHSSTAAPTSTSTPTDSPSPTATTTATNTPSATATATPTATLSATATSTATPSPTATVTPTATATPILGDGIFTLAGTFAAGAEPRALAAGFLSSGEDVDLAAALGGSGALAILSGNGDGDFETTDAVPVGARPLAVAAADFNQDGRVDLAVANSDSDSLSILLGPIFELVDNVAVGSRPTSVVAADFDRDGVADLAATNFGSDTVSILIGRGDGSFASLQRPTLGECPIAVAAGKFDADDGPDLAVANFDTNDVTILLGGPDGDFNSLPTRIAVGTQSSPLTGPAALAMGNFDANDPLNPNPTVDLVVVGTGAGVFLPGNGDGTFGFQRPLPLSLLPAHVASADFDRDSNLDLAVANLHGRVSVLFGLGNGFFDSSVENEYPVGARPVFVVAADLDGDSDVDMAVANSGADTVSVLLNVPAGTPTPTPTATPTVADEPGPPPAPEVVDNVSGERPGSLLVFPRVAANDEEDTTILVENSSNGTVLARCFYLNARRVFPDQPPGPFNPPLWQTTEFGIALAGQQPSHWVASRGRRKDPTDRACTPQLLDCDGAGVDPGQVPPLVDFVGELLCVETAFDGVPLPGNHLLGRAVVQNTAGGAASSYNAVGLQGNESMDFDDLLCVGPSEDCPQGAELIGCPAEWLLTHAADGAPDPKLGPDSISTTRITVVPCSRDYENQIPATVTLQFTATNEFEDRFSASTTVQCWGEFGLGDVSDVLTHAVLGTVHGQTQITPVGSGGFLVVGESLREIGDRRTAAMINLHLRGQRPDGDQIRLPGR
jgi:hypothetical protein